MKTFFLLSKGEYSDWSVIAACSCQDTLDKWKAALEADPASFCRTINEVSTVHVLDPGEQPFKITRCKQAVYFGDDGTITKNNMYSNTEWAPLSDGELVSPVSRYSRLGHSDCYLLIVQASTEEEVAKVVNEKIAEWKALEYGPRNPPPLEDA